MCGKGLVHVVRDVGDEGADAAIVEVHGVDVSNSDTANTVDDTIFVIIKLLSHFLWEHVGLTGKDSPLTWRNRRLPSPPQINLSVPLSVCLSVCL